MNLEYLGTLKFSRKIWYLLIKRNTVELPYTTTS